MNKVEVKTNGGFSDEAVNRFAMFLGDMAGVKDIYVTKIYEDGKGCSYKL